MTTLDDAALDDLRAKAEAAMDAVGDEPWHFLNLGWDVTRDAYTYTVESTAGAYIAEAAYEEIAEHCAAASPAVVLELLAYIRSARLALAACAEVREQRAEGER